MCNDIVGAAEDNSIDIERSEITVLFDIVGAAEDNSIYIFINKKKNPYIRVSLIITI